MEEAVGASGWAEAGSSVPKPNLSDFPEHLSCVYGVVFKLLNTNGFISIKDPIKATIEFDVSQFECGTKSTIQECGLKVGSMVMCNAKKMMSNFDNKYQATKVWFVENKKHYMRQGMSTPERSFHGSIESLQSSTSIESNLIENKVGKILSVYPKYGFIRINRNPKDNIYFHMSVVEDSNEQPLDENSNLLQYLGPGDHVQFSAIITSRSDVTAKWEAIHVHILGEDESSEETTSDNSKLPDALEEVSGIVYRTFTTYGFISIEVPVKAQIYFDCRKVKCGSKLTLDEYNIKVGTKVICNARRAPRDTYKAKYVATCVWLPGDSDGVTSDADAKEYRNLKGTIVNLQGSFGFIRRNLNKEDNVYFHVSALKGFEYGETLEDILTLGQSVMFNARRTMRPDVSVRLQATSVWPDTPFEATSLFQDHDEMYMSDSSEDNPSNNNINHLIWPNLSLLERGGSNNTEASQQTTEVVSEHTIAPDDLSEVETEDSTAANGIPEIDDRPLTNRKTLCKCTGKIYYLSNSLALLRFGGDFQNKALALISVILKRSIRCLNLEDDIEDGECMTFNAVEDLGCPTNVKWKATMVWDKYTLSVSLPDAMYDETMWAKLKEEYTSTQFIKECKLYNMLKKKVSEETMGISKRKKKGGNNEFAGAQIPSNMTYKSGLTGSVMRVSAFHAKVVTKSLEKPVLVQFQNIYVNNKCIVDFEEPYEDILKKGDALHFEYCEMIEKSGEKFEIIPVAWKDKKPKIAEELLPRLFMMCKDIDLLGLKSNKISEENYTSQLQMQKDKNSSDLPETSLTVLSAKTLNTSEKATKDSSQLTMPKNVERYHVAVPNKGSLPLLHTSKNNLKGANNDQRLETEFFQSPSSEECLEHSFETASSSISDHQDGTMNSGVFLTTHMKQPMEKNDMKRLDIGGLHSVIVGTSPNRDPLQNATNNTKCISVELSENAISKLTTTILSNLKPTIESLPDVIGQQLLEQLSALSTNVCSKCKNVNASLQVEESYAKSCSFKCDMWTQTDAPSPCSTSVQVSPKQCNFSCQVIPLTASSSQQTMSTGPIHSENLYHY